MVAACGLSAAAHAVSMCAGRAALPRGSPRAAVVASAAATTSSSIRYSRGAISGPSRRPAAPAAAFAAGFRGLARDAARRGTPGPCRVNLPQNKEDGLLDDDEGGANPAALAPVVLFFLALCAGGVTYREEINTLLASFTSYLEVVGPGVAWAEFSLVYIVLELVAVPAIPLTIAAGALFGPLAGVSLISFSSVVAATISFQIARGVGREWVEKKIAEMDDPRLARVDRAVANDGLRIIALLRLSPLLPFALSNYFYGLTSVELPTFVLASWAGMLPGTIWYVVAGQLGRDGLEGGLGELTSGGNLGWIVSLVVALAIGIASASYVGNTIKMAMDGELEGDDEE